MSATGLHLCHHLGNGRAAIFCQTIDATPDKEVRPEVLGQAVEFVDVAFAITNMHTALGRAC